MAQQPAMLNQQGVILTIGMLCNYERLAIVEPYGIDLADVDRNTMCADLVSSWIDAVKTQFLACLSEDAAITFIQAEGMTDGAVPYREDYSPADNPGTYAETAEPTGITGLIVYYEDPADVEAGKKMRVGKTFMPAVPVGQVSLQNISSTLQGKYATYAGLVRDGIDSDEHGGNKWYRVLSVPYELVDGHRVRTPGMSIPRVVTPVVRGYVATQRRRMVPRS